jgi:hypothetical protein
VLFYGWCVIVFYCSLFSTFYLFHLHESCLGQLPWDRFTGRVPFTEGFLSSGYQLGFSALLISLEFFPHTCNNSSKVVNDVLVGLCFGNYYRESL